MTERSHVRRSSVEQNIAKTNQIKETPIIRLLTFNAFFDGPLFMQRFEYAINKALCMNCDVLCFQEVLAYAQNAPAVFDHCKDLLKALGYKYVYPDNNSELRYYSLLTASRFPFKEAKTIPYTSTEMGREFQHVTLVRNGAEYHILNTHLESMFGYQKTRNKQIYQMTKYIKEKGIQERCVLCGDFNMTYKVIKGLDHLLTPRVNFVTWFASRFFGKKRSCRFDRVYTGESIKVGGLVAVLNKVIPNIGIYPSDHDGILMAFN